MNDPAIQSVLDESWKALQAQYPSAVRPEVDVVRIVTTDEWAPMIADCLSKEGFPYATAPGDGSIAWTDVPNEQMEAFDIARYKCSAMYPRDPSHQEPLSESQLDRLYEYYTGEMTECLISLGYDVPPAPSRQAFGESYSTKPWLPFDSAYATAQDDPEAYALLEKTCPQVPDDLWD